MCIAAFTEYTLLAYRYTYSFSLFEMEIVYIIRCLRSISAHVLIL